MKLTKQQELWQMGQFIILAANKMIKFAEDEKLTNSQTLLNILDRLNEISVKY